MKKRSKALYGAFEGAMELENRSQTLWFRWGLALLLAYVEVAFFLQNVFFGATSPVFLLLSALAAPLLCFLGVRQIRRVVIPCDESRATASGANLVTVLGIAATFGVMILAQIAFWPGSFNNDNIVQLGQVHSGAYNNWHPVLHTWLVFTLPLKLVPQYWFIITLQILWFSLAVGYFLRVLYTTGCPRYLLVLGWFLTVCNPNTIDMMLYPVKDSALSIVCLVLFSQLIRIWTTDGSWLKNKLHLTVFTLLCFLALGLRHNAVLLIAPVLLLVLIFFPCVRRHTAICCAAVLAMNLLWSNAVLPMAGVADAGSRPVEVVGLPMTILSDMYTTEPQALTEDAYAFMDSLATQDQWANYTEANFNSIKWENDTLMPAVNEAGAGKVLSYALKSALRAPTTALKTFAQLTHLVWGFEDTRGFAMGEEIGFNTLGIAPQYRDGLKFAFTSWRSVCNAGVGKYVFMLLGSLILMLLFLAVGQLGGSFSAVFLVLAPMCYNFGTMLLLSGPDYRFFHMNYVIALPIAYIILRKPRSSHGQ